LRVALAQVDSALGDLERNLSRARSAIREAVDGGAELIVFPELCLSGYAIGATDRDVALRADDPGLTELARMAGNRALVVGFPELGFGERVYNSAAFFEAGTLRHVHRKLYLPTYGGFEERKHFSAGTAMRAFGTQFGRVAMLICNDAWQPALAFVACQDGAELMIVPANSSHSDPRELDVRAYWRDISGSTRGSTSAMSCSSTASARSGAHTFGAARTWSIRSATWWANALRTTRRCSSPASSDWRPCVSADAGCRSPARRASRWCGASSTV